MIKTLFFLLFTNIALAQTDTLQDKTDSIKLIIKDEVVVSSTRAGSNSPTTYQTISKQDFSKNNLGQDLPFLLDQTASVVTTSDAGAGIGYTGIRIRGSDATRINVTLNGVPVNDAESQATFWVDLPDVASSTQTIQIQRGVGSSTNGGSSFGGTVSLQTQSPSQKAFVEGNISGGSFSTFKINGKGGTGIHKGFFAEGSGSWITSNGYIDRASSDLKSWFAQAGYTHNNTLLKFLYFGGREKTYQAWNGVPQDSLKTNRTFNDLGTDYGQHMPPYKNQTDNYGQDYAQLLFAQYLPKHFVLNTNLFATVGRGYYEEYKVGTNYLYYFPTYDTLDIYTDLVRQKWLRNVYYGGVFSLSYQYKNIDAVLGGALTQYRGKHYGKVIWADAIPNLDKQAHYYNGQSLKNDFNVYAKLTYTAWQKVNFYIDLQYRYVGYKTNGTTDDLSIYSVKKQWHFFNPKAGVLCKINTKHQVYTSYAMSNREPNRDDIMAGIGSNKTVKQETLHNVEGGYRFVHTLFPFTVNYYLMQYTNQLVLTGKINNVGNPVKENVASSYRTGIELNGSLIAKSRKLNRTVFAANYSFTYSINKIKSFDEYVYTYDENYSAVDSFTQVITHRKTDISFSPSIIAALELVAYPIRGLEISLMNKAISKQYLDNTSNESRKIKPFFYSNLRISYKLPLNRDDREIKLTLLLNNLFNLLYESNGYTYSERYSYKDELGNTQQTPAYTYNYYYPQAGFNFLAGISVRF